VSVTFIAQAVRIADDGSMLPLDGTDAVVTMHAGILCQVLDRIAHLKRKDEKQLFSWYFNGHDGTGRTAATAKHCFPPGEVLRSVQQVEQDLVKHPERYSLRWRFVWRDAGGMSHEVDHLPGVYRGRNCVLYFDDSGVWAKETDPGPREGVHHDLKKEAQVLVSLPKTGEDVTVQVQRITLWSELQDRFALFKRVCIRATRDGAVIFTSTG
jgi:hypothetical protein